ncbi:AcrR family transcriptional regulator [Nocardia sp. GAS34]|jgi:AcrR family transcriptional regulator
MGAVTQLGPGRPRLEPRRRRGPTPRAEILDAAAELFTTRGYASTSTRAIADAVGIRQASLYHHFSAKDDILEALLDQTVSAPLELLGRMSDEPEPTEVRLYALAWFDVHQLSSARWNLGALYLLPELRSERFADFRLRRKELREHYERLAAAVTGDAAADAWALPFRLVESVINIRSDETATPGDVDRLIPDAVLRMLGHDDTAAIRTAAADLLDRLAAQ